MIVGGTGPRGAIANCGLDEIQDRLLRSYVKRSNSAGGKALLQDVASPVYKLASITDLIHHNRFDGGKHSLEL